MNESHTTNEYIARDTRITVKKNATREKTKPLFTDRENDDDLSREISRSGR